jgi:RNA-binding protein
MNHENDAASLSPAQRKALKASAHHLKPVVMIGDAGLSDTVMAEAQLALRAHELIKIRVLGDDRARRDALMRELCSALGCAPVQTIGKLLVVYRPRENLDEGGAPSASAQRRRRGPHRPKKALGARKESDGGKAPPAARKPAAPRRKSAGARQATAPPARPARAGAARPPKAAASRTSASGGGRRPDAGVASKARAAGPSGKSTRAARPKTLQTSPRSRPPGGAAKSQGGVTMTTPRKKSLSTRTAGKRTDLHAADRPPAKKGRPTKATQGPVHLQGKAGPRTGGARSRAKGGKG